MRPKYSILAYSAALAVISWYTYSTQEYLAACLSSFASGVSLCQALYQPLIDESLEACRAVLKSLEEDTRHIIEAQNIENKPRQ